MILSAEITKSLSHEINNINYFIQIAEVKDHNEWHIYINSDRFILSELEYNLCFIDKSEFLNVALKYINLDVYK